MQEIIDSEIVENLNGAFVLITGGAGFIPSHLSAACTRAGARVRLFDNLSESVEPAAAPGVEFICGDIRDADALAKALDGVDYVLHHGAIASVPKCSEEPKAAVDVNAAAVANVMEPLRRMGSKAKVVFASSAAVYGLSASPRRFSENDRPTPHSVYGMSKYAGELIVQSYRNVYGVDARIVRYANVFGPGQPRYIMFDMYNKVRAANDAIEVIGSGRQQRDFVYVDDAVRYTLAWLTKSAVTENVLNIGSGRASTVLDIASTMCAEMGRPDLELRCTGASWVGDVDYLLSDVTRSHELGGPPRVPLATGIRLFIDWMNRLHP